MRVAAIDIGTNSVRMLIAEKFADNLEILDNQLRTPRLGEGIHKNNYLLGRGIERTVTVLSEYQKLIEYYNATPVIVATSAVRDATNQEQFLEQVKNKLGLEINVLSGEEEARLSYLGMGSAMEERTANTLAIDIGGGSTEFIFGAADQLVEFESINLGAVRLFESYKNDLDKIKNISKTMIDPVLAKSDVHKLIGVGGTITTLVAIKEEMEVYNSEVVQGYLLKADEIRIILNRLEEMSLVERKMVSGLAPKRADIILAGSIILLSILDACSQKQIIVSDSSILEGIIYDFEKNN